MTGKWNMVCRFFFKITSLFPLLCFLAFSAPPAEKNETNSKWRIHLHPTTCLMYKMNISHGSGSGLIARCFWVSSSPCSCWRRTSRHPPWAAARSWPDEREESASSSCHPGSRTASSHTSFGPPWRPAPPPAAQRHHHIPDVWRCF